jgi:DNA-binding CsgD family transcriptional regulator
MRGRDKELGVALDMVRAAEAGRGGMLLVEGEPGIGKSRLLGEASAAAAARGLTLSCGSADEPADGMPANRFLPALQEEFVQPAGRNGSVHGTPGWWEQPRARGPQHAAPGQMLIVLDDLQCADPVTLWRLRGLPHHTRIQPPMWMLARSTASADSDAERLFCHLEDAGAVRMQLGPLGDEVVADVAADTLGAAPDQELLALAAGAGGNPLLLAELLAGLQDEGGIRIAGGSARLASAELPQRLRAVVRRWVGQLGPRARQFLAVGAVLGRSFRVDNVAALLGETPAAILPEVEGALAAGILVDISQALAFRRELVWRAVAESVPGPAREALHRQVGEHLLDHGGSPIEAAAHLASGSRPCPRATLARLDRAAQTFLASAPQTAADLTLKVLELTGPIDQERLPRIVTAVEALAAAGRLAEAEDLARSTLAAPMPVPGPADIRLRSLLSYILFYSGRPAAAVSEAEGVLGAPELRGEARDEAEIILMLGVCASEEDTEWARGRAEALLAGAGHHDDAGLVTALLVRAMISWREGRLPSALDAAREAAGLGNARSAVKRHGLARLLLGGMLLAVGQLDEAEEVVRALSVDARAVRPAGRTASPEILAACLAFASGRPEEAVAGAEKGLRLAAAQGTHLFSLYGLSLLATAALRAGDLRTAAQHVNSFQERLSRHGPGYGQTRCLLVAAQVAEACEAVDDAADLAAGLYSRMAQRRTMLLEELTAPPWLVRFALSQEDRPHAEAVSAVAGDLAASNPGFACVAASAAHARGLLYRDPDALSRAAEGSCGPWARASAAEDLGELLIERQDLTQAGQRLEESLAGYDQAAAPRDARRVRRRLRGVGIRRRHGTHAHRPRSGWASLTDTERAVSDLVAQGLTNQRIANEMFLSTHTVAFHLRQVFRKLDISSRVDLARVLTERGHAAGEERAGVSRR